MDLYDVHSRPFNYEPSWSYEAKLAFAQEPVWYINAETGNDLNVGTTSTTALATYAELRSRLMFPPVAFDCVVYVTGTTLDQIIIDGSFPVDSKIHILGVPTVTATGTFGAVTAKSEAGNTLVNIVSATLAANPGKLVRVTSGTAGNLTATTVVMKDLGGGSARCTNFIKKATTAFETGVAAVTPVNGDGFEVLTCPSTTHPYINAGPCEWAIEMLAIAPPDWSYSNDWAVMGFGVFWSCIFTYYLELYGDGTIYINGCGFPGGGGDFSYVDLYDACRAVFQAGGPSKVFALQAQYTADGYVQGIEQSAPEVNSALETMVDPASAGVVPAPAAPAAAPASSSRTITIQSLTIGAGPVAAQNWEDFKRAVSEVLDGAAITIGGGEVPA